MLSKIVHVHVKFYALVWKWKLEKWVSNAQIYLLKFYTNSGIYHRKCLWFHHIGDIVYKTCITYSNLGSKLWIVSKQWSTKGRYLISIICTPAEYLWATHVNFTRDQWTLSLCFAEPTTYFPACTAGTDVTKHLRSTAPCIS